MKKILLGLFFTLVSLNAQMPNTKQLLIVTAENWSTPTGSLQRYERTDHTWKKVGRSIDIKLGRNGLGWGIGLHEVPKDAKIIKKEGDGKAPAGIFKLNQAFGYAPFNINYPYEVHKETDHCVDDVNSKLYNKIVDSTKVTVDYESFEHMKFPKDYYKYGIVVNHNHINEEGAKRGAGSCIFIHIKDVPTAGCTVMSERDIQEVLRWLDPKAEPLLVQGTEGVVKVLWERLR
ncbi:MAG: L,D-transpeptidase family protein [Sulfurovum sp.]|nr:L,D-transpeptidase family protein [Sulfurovum sp.]